MFLGQMIADIEDLVVGFGAVGKMEAQVVVERLFQLDRDPALVRPDLYPAVEQLARTQAIKGANKFAGMIVEGLIAFLELVKFFQHGDRYDNVMFLKIVDAGGIVQDDIGVENERLG